MNSVTQDMLYRQSLVRYALRHGVTKAAIKYRTNRQFIYRWMKRYDGSPQSMAFRSRRPHNHPNQHSEEEIGHIRRMYRRNKRDGLVVLWVKLCRRGYSRSISSLYRVLRRLELFRLKTKNPKRRSTVPFDPALFPGQRVQVDVKHVPGSCIRDVVPGTKYYQYTALDEYSRFRYVEAFDEVNTTNSERFLLHMLRFFRFRVFCVQTDNGCEFTNRFTSHRGRLSLFEKALKRLGIAHHLIRPYTPRHNGKVERSHRKDNEYFYGRHSFHSLEDFSRQLRAHNRRYNNFPMRPLGWRSPRETPMNYLNPM
ncbi:MAG TPA: IS481 family transposase [Synergistaceae bacterium]|jgi:transposase InsO family protein|nr:IS481 family transposase [Synergistaceae bacterium]